MEWRGGCRMKLLDKCARFTRAREAQAGGFYPFFLPIEASDGTEVMIDGESQDHDGLE